MEVRAASTRIATSPEVDVPESVDAIGTVYTAPPPVAARPRGGRPTGAARGRARPAVARPAPLPRHLEYRYIRSDLRRLIITASALLLLMLVLLLIVE